MNPALEKGKAALKEVLAKHSITNIPAADVAFALDVSGSFHHAHVDGTTQKLLEKLVPWGMVFDPDQKLDVFTFSDGESHAVHVGEITPDTCEGYIKEEIINEVDGYNGGTDYHYVIKAMLENFGWAPKAKGLFGGLFGKKETTTPRRSIVLFITDGDNFDPSDTDRILKESQDRGDQVYFLFIGVGTGSSFPFLMKVADDYANTGLVVIRDLPGFLAQDDETLNDQLIGDELITWLKQ